MRLEVFGPIAAVDGFLKALRGSAPPQSRIDSVQIEELPPIPVQTLADAAFEIRSVVGDAPPRPTIPADLATCDACRDEIRDIHQRRYRYPFTNCTNCGPRWSIIRQLPYDRPRTSMAQFPLCPSCRAEYEEPADRRFHAQPIACPACGPRLRLLDSGGRPQAAGDEALQGGRRGPAFRPGRGLAGTGRLSAPRQRDCGRCGRAPTEQKAPPRPAAGRDVSFARRRAAILPGFRRRSPYTRVACRAHSPVAANGCHGAAVPAARGR